MHISNVFKEVAANIKRTFREIQESKFEFVNFKRI